MRDFGELRRMAQGNGCWMWSSSSHIARGHWANTQPSAVRPMRLSNTLTSTNVLPLAVSSPCRRGRTRQAQADPTRCLHGAPGRRPIKKVVPRPTHPWYEDHKQEGGTHEMPSQEAIRQHPCQPLRDFGELRRLARSSGVGCGRVQATSQRVVGRILRHQPCG